MNLNFQRYSFKSSKFNSQIALVIQMERMETWSVTGLDNVRVLRGTLVNNARNANLDSMAFQLAKTVNAIWLDQSILSVMKLAFVLAKRVLMVTGAPDANKTCLVFLIAKVCSMTFALMITNEKLFFRLQLQC